MMLLNTQKGVVKVIKILKSLGVLALLVAFTITFAACDSDSLGDLNGDNGQDEEIVTAEVSSVEELHETLDTLEEDDEVNISLEEGEYEENINIDDEYNFSDLILSAETEHEATINAPMIIDGVDNITIRDMEFKNSTGNAIEILSSQNILIENNAIEESEAFGILVNENSQADIINNELNYNGHEHGYPAVKIENQSEALIEENIISNSAAQGVEVTENSSTEIKNNVISENVDSEITISGESIADIDDNTIVGESGAHNITVFEDSEVVISNNFISEPDKDDAEDSDHIGIGIAFSEATIYANEIVGKHMGMAYDIEKNDYDSIDVYDNEFENNSIDVVDSLSGQEDYEDEYDEDEAPDLLKDIFDNNNFEYDAEVLLRDTGFWAIQTQD